jgi:hypothetical protein
MRIDHDVGIYPEHYAMVLKWYSLAFKDKHPSKADEECYNLFRVIHNDVLREDKEVDNTDE